MTGLIVIVLVDLAITAAILFGFRRFFPRRPVMGVCAASVAVSLLLLLLAKWMIASPNPGHVDGPGMGAFALTLLAAMALPFNIAGCIAMLAISRERRRVATRTRRVSD